MTIQMKATEQYFPVVLFIVLYKVVLTFESVDEILKCDKRRFHSRDQQPCKFFVTNESFYIRKEFNSHRIGFTLQHGRRFIVFALQHGRRDVSLLIARAWRR